MTIDEQIENMDLFNYAEEEVRTALQRVAELEAENERLRAAIANHRDNFPDEALEGERELWSSLDSKQ